MYRRLPSVVCVLVLVTCVQGEGVLERARIATRGNPAPDEPANKTGDAGSNSCVDDADDSSGANEFLGQVLGGGFFLGLASPFLAPHLLLEDNLSHGAMFPPHPYARSDTPYLDLTGRPLGPDQPASMFDPAYRKPWAVRAAIENGNDFSGLNRLSGSFAVDSSSRFGLSSQWDHFFERYGGCTDEFVIGTLNLTYRFAQSERVQFHAGAGGRVLLDRWNSIGGFNFLYGADVFVADPVVLSSRLELGNLDRAFVLRLRTTVGWQFGHGEGFIGYDWLRIGGADLHGPMAGIRFWF